MKINKKTKRNQERKMQGELKRKNIIRGSANVGAEDIGPHKREMKYIEKHLYDVLFFW